jgi:serine/threonine protein phosphatase PrpC
VGGRASIVGAAETSVGKVRDHNEDSHFIDPEQGVFLVCDGMGGHAAGEVASALAVATVRDNWLSDATQAIAEQWLQQGTPEAHRQLIAAIHDGAVAAHDAIIDEATRDRTKGGMGTTLVGAMVVGGEIVFAHCGDSRAYLVRDGIAMQLTEDHTLLARLLAAGVDVDVHGDGARFKSMLTNALGIGQECKISTFVLPLADGDRFLLCSDGITEYLPEPEIGEVLCTQPSPARAAQRLVELALQRGGADNATALVVRVLEAGESARPSDLLRKDQTAIELCPLWGKLTPQQRLRALRIALPRDHAAGQRIPAQTLGDRVAWILLEGEVEQDATVHLPGSLLYPEALLADRPLPDKEGLGVPRIDVRALAIRSDDFRELCDDDPEIGEALLEALGAELAARAPSRRTGNLNAPVEAAEAAGDESASRRAVTRPLGEDEGDPEIELVDRDGDAARDDATSDSAIPEPVAADEVASTHARVDLPARQPTAEELEDTIRPTPVSAIAIPAVPRRATTLGSRPSSERLILQHEERDAAAADLEDALTKLADDVWDPDEPDAAAARPPPAANPDHNEPEISIEDAEISIDAADLPDAAASGHLPAMAVLADAAPSGAAGDADDSVVEIEAEPPPDPEPPPADVAGEEPEEITMTVDD